MIEAPAKRESLVSKAFNLPALKKSRLHWVDYLKGIAIILVVYRHSLLGIDRSGVEVPQYLENANMIFYSFRMPLFFILSGIFISRSLAKRTVKEFIASKFETLMYPYFVWVTIQITLQIVLSNYTNSNRGLIDYTYIFYQPRNLDQFWYLPALFNATVIFIFIKKYITRNALLLLLIGLGFYFLAFTPLVQKVSMISDWMEFFIFFALGDAISQFFFRENVQRFFKSYITLLAAIPVFIVAQVFYLNNDMYYLTNAITQSEFLLVALVGCFTMLAFSFRLQQWNILSWLRILGYHSIYIYVMHVMIAAFTRTFLVHVAGIQNVYTLLILCIISASVLPVIIYNLFIRDNFAWFLFTYKRKSIKHSPSETKQNSAAVYNAT